MANKVTPGTFTATTSAVGDMNNIRDILRQYGGYSADPKPLAIVYSSSNVTLTASAFTQLTFNTTTINRNGLYTNNQFVVPSTWGGWYDIKATVDFDSPAGNKEVRICINGDTAGIAKDNNINAGGDAFARITLCADAWLTGSDTIRLYAFHDNPSDISALGAVGGIRFSARWVATSD